MKQPAEAPELAVEQGRADSATTLAPKAEKSVLCQPRRAWGRSVSGFAHRHHCNGIIV